MCNLRERCYDWGLAYIVLMGLCGSILRFSFVIAALFISVIPNATIISSGDSTIGDMLDDSSALFEVNSPAIAEVKFEIYHEYTIFETDHIPPIITEDLHSQQIYISVLWRKVYDLNYLGSYNPFYLLAGSSIQYNITIEPTEMLNLENAACLYLFDNRTSFNNFVNSNLNSQVIIARHCFTSNATYSYFFNITTDGVYYVGAEVESGFTIQANGSVVCKRYNTTGLKQTCDHSHTCTVTVCNTFICADESTTYFLIQPTNTTDMLHTFSSSILHGSIYDGFIATTVLGIFFCCCCCCLNCFSMCIIPHMDCDHFSLVPVMDALFDCCEGCHKKMTRRRQFDSRISHKTRGSVDSFDKDLNLKFYLSSVVDTPSTDNTREDEERNIDPPLPSLVPIEEENNQNELSNQLAAEPDDDPPKYWDIFNQEGNTTNVIERQQQELLVQHTCSVTEQSPSDTIDHSEDNNINTISAANPLNTVVIHTNQAESVQSVPLDDVLLPLPSPLEAYMTLSLHSPEVESVGAVNECSNSADSDVLPHETIEKEKEEMQSSDEDTSTYTPESSTVESLPMYESLPSKFKRLNESHAPIILSAIKDLVGLWDIVGIHLGIDNADLERIKYRHSTDVDHCRTEMILVWLRRRDATRHRLIEALKEAGRYDIAHKVKGL
ncbi:PREDICTED: uncharacterized protein LOC109590396 [Amphimedon queenslandica]|uniref:Death domain-containing protein n=2 Tax=Amphimedon queenslandica TaxID=400682 RepID=A0AAN0JXF8_AMPQE|nr:PREDICTED: uncharacterized protein LOC109590396 [Amphimedon queenslandica]|eukprot:XP_019861881.1 PREDICTED: uncharacterized protein LOC109590396 [Amphimedon queenslandica]